jgi:hypothetical protein
MGHRTNNAMIETETPNRRSHQRIVSLQDAGTSHHAENDVPVYHTHGLRQYLGKCKVHKSLDCPHLKNWKPGKGLGKTIMREWEKKYDEVPKSWRCQTCFSG